MIRLALAVAALALLEPGLLFAQEKLGIPDTTLVDIQPGEREAPVAGKIGIFKLKNIPATETAELVRGLLGESGSVIAEPVGNSLLIRASAENLQQAKAVLEHLDQTPKMIAFEVMIADLPAKTEEGKPAAHAGTDEAWLARVKNQADGGKNNISTIRLTATGNQTAMIQFGGQTPVVTGMQQGFAGGGRGAAGGLTRSPIVQQTQTGTIVQCTARVLDDDTIIAEFEIERSRLAPEGGTLLEESDDAGALRAPGMLTTTCKTTVKLKPGKPRVITGLKNQAGNSSTVSVIVVTAELITAED
jgi:type II secretory pathway component GspD/PulD (secretin)